MKSKKPKPSERSFTTTSVDYGQYLDDLETLMLPSNFSNASIPVQQRISTLTCARTRKRATGEEDKRKAKTMVAVVPFLRSQSAKPDLENDLDLERREKTTWVQEEDEILLHIPIREGLTRHGIDIEFTAFQRQQYQMTITIDQLPFLHGILYGPIQEPLTRWNIQKQDEDGQKWLVIHLVKRLDTGILEREDDESWPCLFSSHLDIEETLDMASSEHHRGFDDPPERLSDEKRRIMPEVDSAFSNPPTSTRDTAEPAQVQEVVVPAVEKQVDISPPVINSPLELALNVLVLEEQDKINTMIPNPNLPYVIHLPEKSENHSCTLIFI